MGRGNASYGADLFALFATNSCESTINEPTYDPNCLYPENIGKVTSAIVRVVGHVPQKADA